MKRFPNLKKKQMTNDFQRAFPQMWFSSEQVKVQIVPVGQSGTQRGTWWGRTEKMHANTEVLREGSPPFSGPD